MIVPPLLLGGNRPIVWALDALLAAAALTVLALNVGRSSERPHLMARRSALQLALGTVLLALFAWLAFQASPLSPLAWHHPLFGLAFDARGAISLDPPLTLTAIGWLSALGLALPAIAVGTDRNRSRVVLGALVASAGIVAVWGVAVWLAGWDTLGLAPKFEHRQWVTGTFANRNHAAAFLTIGAVCALALWHAPSGGRPRDAGWLIAAAALFAVVLLTGSRAGSAAAVAGLVAMFVVPVQDGALRRWRAGAIAFLLIAPLAVTAVWLARGNTELGDRTRISLYHEAVEAIAQRPALGHGGGAYENVQPLVHRAGTSSGLIWNRAHSTYLEAAATLGLPAVSLVLAALGAALWLARPRGDTAGPASRAALGAAVASGLHALVDFSVQIQAVAIALAVLLGLALGEGCVRDRPLASPLRTSSRKSAGQT